MAYKAPVWEDGRSPAISAENLNALSQAAEGAQVLYGNSAPTSSTKGAIGQFYLAVVADSDGNYPLYQCVAIANGSCTWRNVLSISANLASKLGLSTPATIEDAIKALLPAQYNGKSAQRVSVFTESVNFVAPDNVIGKIHVMLFGGGGGGGGTSSQYYHGGGGGGGGHMVETDVAVNPGQSYPIIIGAGGSPGTSAKNATAGGKGGSTTAFGLTAEGGDGGGGGTSSGAGRGGDGGTGGAGGSMDITYGNGKTGPAGGNGSYGGGGAGGTMGGGGSDYYCYGGNGGNGGTYGGGGAGGDAKKGNDTNSSRAVNGGTGGAGGTYGGRGSDGESFASGSYTPTIDVLSSGGTAVDSASTFFSPYFLLLKELLYASAGTRSGSKLGGGGYGDELYLEYADGRGGCGYGVAAAGSGGAGYGDPGDDDYKVYGGGGAGFFEHGARGGNAGKAGMSGVACLIYYVSLEEETT